MTKQGHVMTAMKPFHEKIKERIEALNLSQEKVAERLEVSQTLVSRWARGKNVPDVHQAFRLARLLGLSLDYLADDEVDDPPVAESIDPDLRLLIENAKRIGYDKALNRVLNPSGIEPVYEFRRNPGGKK